jgi:hypothetical protein
MDFRKAFRLSTSRNSLDARGPPVPVGPIGANVTEYTRDRSPERSVDQSM